MPSAGQTSSILTMSNACWVNWDPSSRREAAQSNITSATATGITSRFRTPSKSFMRTQTSGQWPSNAGRPLELVGAWADITKRKEAEQAALNANAELHKKTKRSLSRLMEKAHPTRSSRPTEWVAFVLYNVRRPH